jgi:hypothetical protein
MTVTASEAADYIHEMLEGLHAMADQPANHKLRLILWQAMGEARRIRDDEEKPLPSISSTVLPFG